MYCPNCGAFYPGEKEYQCPYCKTENPNMVEKKRDEILKVQDFNQFKFDDALYEKRKKENNNLVVRMFFIALGIMLGVSVLLSAVAALLVFLSQNVAFFMDNIF